MTSRKLSTKQIQQIQSCYEGLGPRSRVRGSAITFHDCPGWRNPVMSPILPGGLTLSANDISVLERHFARDARNGNYDTKTPYISLIEGAHATAPNRSRLAKAGWSSLGKDRSWLNIWTEPLPIEVPKGFTYTVGNVFEPRLHRDFRRTQSKNFGTAKGFDDALDRLFRKLGKKVVCVVIYNRKSKAVAAGLVASGKSGSFLICGSVDSRYRGRGLWKLLVAVRQSVSPTTQGRTWLLLTRNLHIAQSGQLSREIETYTKLKAVKT